MNHAEFYETIWGYYRKYKRTMPWRLTHDPYKIWVSEVMLQQTQVARVIEKYEAFLQRFPTVQDLASAPLKDVIEIWLGLGYNRRAQFLHQAAKMIHTQWQGNFPHDQGTLSELPGVGFNTAGAILAYSFNQPVIFIETNIRRTYIYHFFSDKSEVSDKDIFPLIEQTLYKENPREWYWALMDYGSYLKQIIPNPNRKSKHYTRQSPFEGSLRQLRASIMRSLIANGPLSTMDLSQALPDTRLHLALKSLIKEKMINYDGKKYSLEA